MKVLGIPLIVAVIACGCTSVAPPKATTETRPALLANLDGNWTMTGDVLGKPVTYNLTAGPVLAQSFTELHMTDAHQPPTYEARVFIGFDKKSGQIIAHWLDVFGAMGSIPHGAGKIADSTLEFTFRYADGPFRDRLTYNPGTDKWQFEIESSTGNGPWKHFASYAITRVK